MLVYKKNSTKTISGLFDSFKHIITPLPPTVSVFVLYSHFFLSKRYIYGCKLQLFHRMMANDGHGQMVENKKRNKRNKIYDSFDCWCTETKKK